VSSQVLFYEEATPVSEERHQKWAVETGTDFAFARRTNSVPLMAVEFPSAAQDYAIVFAGTAETMILPAAILGIEDKQNLYITDDGGWKGAYIPAFVRRYPFVFATNDEGKTFTLCIDEGFAGCNQEDRGQRLFQDDGGRTDYLEGVLKFLQEYQVQHQRTHIFTQRLRDLDLLEPMQANVALTSGEKFSLAGFQVVSREKLKKLSGEQAAELLRSDELELIYTHLQSLRNFSAMADRLTGTRAS
jgi:hypothetical protein